MLNSHELTKVKNKQLLKKQEHFKKRENFCALKLKTLYPDRLNQELKNIDEHKTPNSDPPQHISV